MSRPPVASTCRSCDAPLRWAITDRGRRIPLDPAPVDLDHHGALIVVPEENLVPGAGVHVIDRALSLGAVIHKLISARGVTPERARELITERGLTAHVSHFATCPNARAHRRTGRKD